MRLALLVAALVAVLAAADPPTVSRGREVYEKRCTGCHSLDTPKVGPALRGIYGRRAAADPKFPYSDALRAANLTWDDAALQKWLADPDTVVPGNDMSFRLENADERTAIVEYLKQLPGKAR
jgi:cytochrome c